MPIHLVSDWLGRAWVEVTHRIYMRPTLVGLQSVADQIDATDAAG